MKMKEMDSQRLAKVDGIPSALPEYAPGKLTVAGEAFPPLPVISICAHSI